jgi:hypothetical protein
MGETIEEDVVGPGGGAPARALRPMPREIPIEALAPGRRLRLEAVDGETMLACTVEVTRIDDHGIVVRTLDPLPGPWPDTPGGSPVEPFGVGVECQFRVPVDGALLVGTTCVLEASVVAADPHSRVLRLAVPSGASRVQRRRHRRIAYEGSVRWRSAVDEGPRRWRGGTAVDLSSGGLRLMTVTPRRAGVAPEHVPPVGEVLDLRLPLPDADGNPEPLDLVGVVVGTSRAFATGPHLHVRFTGLGTEKLARLRNYVAARR